MPATATTRPATAEEAARAAMDERNGKPLTDQEWTTYKARLLAYVRLLKSWERKEFSP